MSSGWDQGGLIAATLKKQKEEQEMELKIKLHEAECLPQQNGDWFDLVSSTTYEYEQGDYFLIDLGVSIELPDGYEAIIAPRSSTFKNYNILQANGIGIIDNDYCGDNDRWMMPVVAMERGILYAGTRVCQFRIQKKQPQLKFIAVGSLENKERGGFGSTGK